MTTLIETYLNSLPDDILTLNVNMSYDKCITSLPDLTRFQNLQSLNCHNTKITSLPNLPKSLKKIYCALNKFTYLPNLTCIENLEELYCYNNNLTSLPNLPQNIKIVRCFNNPICNIVDGSSLSQIKQNVEIVNKFRHLYYCLKYKKQFRKWLWEKIREPKIMRTFNPLYLIDNLKDDDDLDAVLDNWK